METTDKVITSRQIVSREECTAARKELLRKEKELFNYDLKVSFRPEQVASGGSCRFPALPNDQL
jgi:hypothetical protein